MIKQQMLVLIDLKSIENRFHIRNFELTILPNKTCLNKRGQPVR